MIPIERQFYARRRAREMFFLQAIIQIILDFVTHQKIIFEYNVMLLCGILFSPFRLNFVTVKWINSQVGDPTLLKQYLHINAMGNLVYYQRGFNV